MIKREDMQEIAKQYGKDITIGVFGSHSAEEVGMAAKAAGLKTVVVCQRGREELYTKYNPHLFDEAIVLDKFADITKPAVVEELVGMSAVFIPNRSFSVYAGYDAIENVFSVPMYGNRMILRAEDRDMPKNQYWLLEQGGIRYPKAFGSYKNIDRLAIVKVQQKEHPLERAFFYPTTPEEFVEQGEALVDAGVIEKKTLYGARIEEFALGPRFNANFQAYALEDKFGQFDFLGFEDRVQTNLGGLLNLPAKEQLKLDIYLKNEEVGHKGVTMRESLKPQVYHAAEKFMDITKKEYAPGMIGLFSLQGAMPYGEDGKPEFVVFDVSPRIPGAPCLGPTSPEMRRLSLKFGQTIEAPLDLCMMELKEAASTGRLGEVVT